MKQFTFFYESIHQIISFIRYVLYCIVLLYCMFFQSGFSQIGNGYDGQSQITCRLVDTYYTKDLMIQNITKLLIEAKADFDYNK